CKPFIAQQRIEPDEAPAGFMQPLYFLGYTGSGVPVQTVGDQDHDRPLSQDTARPVVVEIGDALSDARAARPILDGLRDLVESDVDILVAKIARDVREPRAEEEGEYAVAIV